MKKLLIIITAAIVLTFSQSEAEGSELNRFNNITTYEASGEYRIVMAFDGQPESRARFFEKSIQIDFPRTVINTKKKVFEINHAGIDKIKIYQFNPTTTRIRIIPSIGMDELKESISMKIRGNKLVVKVAPKATVIEKTVTLPSPAPEKTALEKTSEKMTEKKTTEEEEVAIQELKSSLNGIKETSLNLDGKKPLKAGFLTYSEHEIPTMPSMSESLVKMVIALAVVLSVVFLVGFIAKKYLGGDRGAGGPKQAVKVLSNHFIGVKKNVTIIELAGEVMVLGVTNNSINLLATYNDPEKIEMFRLGNRLPKKPLGTFSKLPFISRKQNRDKAVANAFAKAIENYTESLDEKKTEQVVETKKTKEEMISSVTRTIADRFQKLESAVV